ncbi:hypothetical protein BDV37DRAFT_265662 [Aspergillus pseudonomiae]|uniref:Uncharacterized protein n=1 Tax=Aspergillus pseudonomiae TaxID=1506151 RepID=A0A5N7CT87_9EURO|nr:uncharacterized protein BDV37DRAFT_265662 [Aspergillus pseudonomiae]KAE8397442.1 hypothetical protein BDV37DRAFT_265662 [Aspergillus pseudonomiae]
MHSCIGPQRQAQKRKLRARPVFPLHNRNCTIRAPRFSGSVATIQGHLGPSDSNPEPIPFSADADNSELESREVSSLCLRESITRGFWCSKFKVQNLVRNSQGRLWIQDIILKLPLTSISPSSCHGSSRAAFRQSSVRYWNSGNLLPRLCFNAVNLSGEIMLPYYTAYISPGLRFVLLPDFLVPAGLDTSNAPVSHQSSLSRAFVRSSNVSATKSNYHLSLSHVLSFVIPHHQPN